MHPETEVLLIFAFAFFALATVGIPSPPRFNWLPAGLACWVASVLLGGLGHG